MEIKIKCPIKFGKTPRFRKNNEIELGRKDEYYPEARELLWDLKRLYDIGTRSTLINASNYEQDGYCLFWIWIDDKDKDKLNDLLKTRNYEVVSNG